MVAGEKAKICSVLHQLDSWAQRLDRPAQGTEGNAKIKYDAEYMLQAFRCSMMLHDKGSLWRVLQHAASLTLAGSSEALLDSVPHKHTFPSASTVRRSHFIADLTMIEFEKQSLEENSRYLIYCWADSSPQKGVAAK